MKVTTNNVPRDFLDITELTDKEVAELDNTFEPGDFCFIRYKGNIYHADDFMVSPPDLQDWHGIYQDTFSSGILMKFVEDDKVLMGRYYAGN